MAMLTTRLTTLLGCEIPIQQAGMGGLPSLPLVVAVSAAGGFGMLGAAGLPAPLLTEILDRLAAQGTRPFGVNFLLPYLTDPGCVSVAARRARLVDFFYGAPDAGLVARVHTAGALAGWQVGSLAEARAAAAAGCDVISAQGIEAGGHVRGRVSMLASLARVLDAVPVPVIAAGGIGTGRAMAAALAAGADGVRIGTRLLGAAEAGIHPTYLAALIAAEAEDTVYTGAFTVNSMQAPHRVLRSSLAAAEAFAGPVVGEVALPSPGQRAAVRRFESVVPLATTTGEVAAMPLWAGESVGAIQRAQPAAEILTELARDAERLLRRWT